MRPHLVFALALGCTQVAAQSIKITTPDVDKAAERLAKALPEAMERIDPAGIKLVLARNASLDEKAEALEREVSRLKALNLKFSDLVAEATCGAASATYANVLAQVVSPLTQTARTILDHRCTRDVLPVGLANFQGPPGTYILRVTYTFPRDSTEFSAETKVRSLSGGPPVCHLARLAPPGSNPREFSVKHECDVAIRVGRN